MQKRIKKTYICRDIQEFQLQTRVPAGYRPEAGDTGVFEVLDIGKHQHIQSDSRLNAAIVPGDLIMAAFGTRYATEQFEGYLPENLQGELHILGAGGTIGIVHSMHDKFKDIGPTTLRLKGLVTDARGEVINTKKMYAAQLAGFSGAAAGSTRVILSLGSSMDSGKTTTAAFLIHGLKEAGYEVAYIKLTGTIYTKDAQFAYDLGADVVADFGNFGYPSTYMCSREELLNLYESLLRCVIPVQPDYVVMEIADGLLQRETKMLLSDYRFRETIEGVVFSAGDSLAAINGLQLLNNQHLYPLCISGCLTASPLLRKEVAENCSVPILTIEELATPACAEKLVSSMKIKACM